MAWGYRTLNLFIGLVFSREVGQHFLFLDLRAFFPLDAAAATGNWVNDFCTFSPNKYLVKNLWHVFTKLVHESDHLRHNNFFII